MARLIQIGSTFRPDDLLCGIGFCAGLLRFRLTARVLDRRSFFRAHGASRSARFQSEPGAPCVRELMRFGEARAPTRVLAARLPEGPDEQRRAIASRGPGGSPYASPIPSLGRPRDVAPPGRHGRARHAIQTDTRPGRVPLVRGSARAIHFHSRSTIKTHQTADYRTSAVLLLVNTNLITRCGVKR